MDLIVFADYGAPNDDSRAVARLAGEEDPRLMITGGDNTYIVTLPQLLDDNLFGPLRDALSGAPNYGTVGDHDIPFPVGQRALADALEWPNLGERYDLRYGPVQVVALGLRADAADVAFARRALARPGPLARFVVTHQPIKAGNPVLPVIAAAPVTAVLAGHLHAYERREVAGAPGVPFFTVGTGGAPRNDERTPRSPDAVAHLLAFGVMRVHLEGDRATYAFVDTGGAVRDRAAFPLTP
ncbi:MAG: metallophosphoesterase [Thermoleophilia bacterium]